MKDDHDMSHAEPDQRGGAARAPAAPAAGAGPMAGAESLAATLAARVPGAATAAERRAAIELLPRMGGIALKNGLVLVSDNYWAAAVREADGNISVSSGRKTRLPSGRSRRGLAARGRPAAGPGVATGRRAGIGAGCQAGSGGGGGAGVQPVAQTGVRRVAGAQPGARPGAQLEVGDLQGLPMLRGLARFAETLLVLAQVKLRMPQAELPLEGGRVAVALATAYAATTTIRSLGPKSTIVQETGAALAAFVPAVLSLRNSTISGYHGAEHKVIAGREAELRASAAGVPYTARAGQPSAAAASAPKEHDRCGSNLVGPLLLTTIAANALIRGKSRRMTPAGSAVATAVSLGAALEALRWATRHGDSLAARLLMSPGRLIQKTLSTSEPTVQQLEVAERAMKELLRLEAAGV